MRTTSRTALSVGVLMILGAMCLPANAGSAFTTTAKSAVDPHPHHRTQLWQIRPGDDGSFDRIVFDERFSPSGYSVRYVHHVTDDASGHRVHLKGHHFLSVSIPNAGTDGAAGASTDVHAKYTPLLPEVRQIKATGDFEGVLSFGIGLRHRHGFRVNVLHHPLRLIIDVAH
jgi:hypothetical protein